jgi:hypothetical protein
MIGKMTWGHLKKWPDSTCVTFIIVAINK